MESYICLLCPAVVAFLLYEKLLKKHLDIRDTILLYAVFLLLINTVAAVAMRFIFKISDSISYTLSVSPTLAIEYIVIAFVMAIVWAIILASLTKNFEVELIVKKEQIKKVNKNANPKKATKRK